jgi:hypothetical protein
MEADLGMVGLPVSMFLGARSDKQARDLQPPIDGELDAFRTGHFHLQLRHAFKTSCMQ